MQAQSKSPEYLSRPHINSHNTINSSSNFHLKTQNDRTDEDHHRSPDINRTEFRDTWRKPRMPYNNKLPDVFFNQQKKSRKVKEDVINKIGTMVKNSQSNEAQKLLKPLHFKEEEIGKSTENRNPLNPVKKMIKIFTKLEENVKDIDKMSRNNFKINENTNQCITLEVVKRGHNTGTIKKMLHVPTLTLMCVREEPITEKQSRNFIRDWTEVWSKKLCGEGSTSFVIIHDVKFNYPQGAISIFMEYFRSQSLLNLLDLTATLPESVIRQVFSQVLTNVESFYNQTNMHFGGLSPSQIMFTDDNKVKLSLGLFYHIPNLKADSIYHIRGHIKNNIFDFNSTHSKFMKTTIDKSVNLDIQRSVDIFKIGLIMLNCAIGSFQNFEQSTYLFSTIKDIFTEQGQKMVQRQNLCCIIHSEQFLLQLNPSSSETDRIFKKNGSDRFITYLKLLKDRFSIHFLNFLCQALKLSHFRRATLSDLMESPFITAPHDNDNRTVKIGLADLLEIGRGWNQQQFESGIQQKLESFLTKLRIVLEDTNHDVLTELLNNKQKIYSLGKEVGLNSQILGKKLQKLITDILREGR